MRDLKNPFCPVEPIKLFCSSKEFLELLKNFCDAFLNKIEQEFSYRNIDIINNIINNYNLNFMTLKK